MNIDIEFFRKLNPGDVPESYADRLEDCVVEDQTWIEPTLDSRFEGYLEADGRRVLILGDVQDGRVIELELTEVDQEDTFAGIPLSIPPDVFQKRIREMGIESSWEEKDWRLKFAEIPIFIYYDEGEIDSIVWSQFEVN